MESETAFSLISNRVNEIIKGSNEIINENNTKAVNPRSIQKGIVSHGRLFLLRYVTPIGLTELPYYHIFPPVLTLAVRGRYINGVNLFYLPKRVRRIAYDRLTLRMTNEGSTFPRSLVRYDIMKRMRVTRAALAPAIKNYNFKRMGPVAVEFHKDLWEEILFGETSELFEKNFRKATPQVVHLDSIQRIIKVLQSG
jgi:hypothetical protein